MPLAFAKFLTLLYNQYGIIVWLAGDQCAQFLRPPAYQCRVLCLQPSRSVREGEARGIGDGVVGRDGVAGVRTYSGFLEGLGQNHIEAVKCGQTYGR